MRIPDNQTGGVGAAGVNRTQETVTATSAHRAAAGSRTEASSNDEIQLSQLAGHLKAQSPGSVEREAKIEQLRTQVASGTYHPDNEKISHAMIDEALGASQDVKKKQ